MSDKDKKIEQPKDSMEAAVERALEKALPSAVMASGQVMAQTLGNLLKPPAPAQRVADRGAVCRECGQKLSGCRGEHVKMYVGPANPRDLKSFPGVYINGVQYISTRLGELVLVPKNNDIATFITAWSNSEEDFRRSKDVNQDLGGPRR